MKIKPNEIENFIIKLNPYKNPILLYGPDEGLVFNRTKKIIKTFLKSKEDILNGVTICDFNSLGSKDINEKLGSKSFLSSKEVVRIINVNDKIIDKIDFNFKKDESTLVILNTKELLPRSRLRKYFEEDNNCAIIACYKVDSAQLKNTIYQFGLKNNIKITDAAKDFLMEVLGNNYQIIVNELDKILLLDKKIIDYDDIKFLISSYGHFSEYENLIFNCLSGNINSFGDSLDDKVHSISEANSLIAYTKNFLFLFNNAISLYNGKNLDTVINTYMPKYLFKKRQVFENIVKNKTTDNIGKSLELIQEIEFKIRKNQSLYKIILFRGMINLAKKMR